MEIKCFQCNMLQENCYVAYDGATADAVVIDCGAYFEDERQAIVRFIRSHGLKLCRVLCTHGHFDHCFGNDLLWTEFGLKPEVSQRDENLMDLSAQMRSMMGQGYHRPVPPVGRFIADGETITFGHCCLRALPTPGHTPGGLSFYSEADKTVFTGDTLFRMSVGRTDFEGGSWTQLMDSLVNVLGKLPDDTVVFPGHGPKTVMRDEKLMNPYFQ